MSVYRVRIRDQIYALLQAESSASGASPERLVEACILDAIALRHAADGAATIRVGTRRPAPSLPARSL